MGPFSSLKGGNICPKGPGGHLNILRPFLAKQDSPLGTLCPKGTSKAARRGTSLSESSVLRSGAPLAFRQLCASCIAGQSGSERRTEIQYIPKGLRGPLSVTLRAKGPPGSAFSYPPGQRAFGPLYSYPPFSLRISNPPEGAALLFLAMSSPKGNHYICPKGSPSSLSLRRLWSVPFGDGKKTKWFPFGPLCGNI